MPKIVVKDMSKPKVMMKVMNSNMKSHMKTHPGRMSKNKKA